MAAVSIVYSSDGESWYQYFSNYLQRVFSEISIELIEDTNLHQLTVPKSKVRGVFNRSKVNIFIVSPGYVHFLITNPEVNVRDVSTDPRRTVIFLCGTSLEDFNLEDSRGGKIADRFPPFNKQCLLSYPQHDEMLERVVGLLEPDSVATLGRKGESEEGKSKSPQHKLKEKRKRKSTSFKFVPNQVHCEGNREVVISFDELVATDENEVNVEVEIEGDTDSDGPTKVLALWLNPYTYSFTAPERRLGTFKAQLFMAGKPVGSEDLEYSSLMVDSIVGLHLIYIRQLNELCSVLKENRLLTSDVDKRMSKILRDESGDLIPVAAFEYFHGIHRFQNIDRSDFELPTMFHLTAKYNLRELGQQLTDLPDARHSYCIYNSDNRLPEDVARSNNNSDLAVMFENFREGDTFRQLYDSYIIMRGSNPGQGNYLNRGVKPDGDESGSDYEDVPSELTITNNPYKFATDDYIARSSEKLLEREEERAVAQNYVEELENPYESRFQLQQQRAAAAVAPSRFIEDGPPTTIPRNQQELIGIMEQVKSGQLTMTDAEVLFKEWQIRHQKKPASIKQKEDQLAKIREETEKSNKKDKDTFHRPLFYKKASAPGNQIIPEIMPGTKQLKPAAVEALKSAKPSKVEVSTDRSSTTSSSSRESTCSVRSRASTTSGIDIDETIQEEVAPKLLPKPRGNRRSVCLQKLEKELSSPGALEPPPLPPRVLGQTLPRPAMPTPKPSKMAARQEEEDTVDSSPEDSYVDVEQEISNVSITSDDMYMIMMENPGRPPPTDRNMESPSKSMIHQESMPELRNPPAWEKPRKSSLPNIANPSSVPIPRLPFSGVPEEAEEYDSTSSSSSNAMARQFQLPKDGFNIKLKKVTPQVKPVVLASTQVTYAVAAPKPVQPKPKLTKVPPGVPQRNK